MSGSLLESARSALEEIEALEVLAVDTLGQKPSGAKASMEQQGTLKNVVEGMTAAASTLGALHDDIGGTFGQEVAKMRGVGVFTNFYGALKETREYYARHGATAAIGQQQASSQAAVARAKRVETKFSGEETWGKYLDLSARHREFCNLPNAPVDLDYVTYLRHLGSKPFSTHVAESKKTHGGYVRYAAAMDAYLTDFWARTQPLVPLEPLLAEPLRAFEKSYAEKNQTNGEALDLRTFRTVEALEALGLDRLKRALQALGMKCGGDVKARAARLFSVRGVPVDKIDAKLKTKKRAREEPDRKYRTLLNDARVDALLDHLRPVLDATTRRAERKLTRTKDEIDAEARDEEFGIVQAAPEEEESDDEDPLDAPLYNPKNLPLGWDGRPIPYWLYKLHGLDQEFKCEICGDASYWGRRAFDQHFNEWRHSHGMRCLRIPNSAHFHGVTKMDDAVALWEQLQERHEAEAFKAERDEEYEDSDGNVLNRATYEDLARQGML